MLIAVILTPSTAILSTFRAVDWKVMCRATPVLTCPPDGELIASVSKLHWLPTIRPSDSLCSSHKTLTFMLVASPSSLQGRPVWVFRQPQPAAAEPSGFATTGCGTARRQKPTSFYVLFSWLSQIYLSHPLEKWMRHKHTFCHARGHLMAPCAPIWGVISRMYDSILATSLSVLIPICV